MASINLDGLIVQLMAATPSVSPHVRDIITKLPAAALSERAARAPNIPTSPGTSSSHQNANLTAAQTSASDSAAELSRLRRLDSEQKIQLTNLLSQNKELKGQGKKNVFAQVQGLKGHNTNLRGENSVLKQENNNLKQTINSLKRTIGDLEARLEHHERSPESFRRGHLEDRLAQHEELPEKLRHELDDLSQPLRAQVQGLKGSHSTLIKRVESADGQVATLKGENMDPKEPTDHLWRELDETKGLRPRPAPGFTRNSGSSCHTNTATIHPDRAQNLQTSNTPPRDPRLQPRPVITPMLKRHSSQEAEGGFTKKIKVEEDLPPPPSSAPLSQQPVCMECRDGILHCNGKSPCNNCAPHMLACTYVPCPQGNKCKTAGCRNVHGTREQDWQARFKSLFSGQEKWTHASAADQATSRNQEQSSTDYGDAVDQLILGVKAQTKGGLTEKEAQRLWPPAMLRYEGENNKD